MSMNIYSDKELKNLFKSIGQNVQIDKTSIFLNSKNIRIGSNVRIDAFCHFSAGERGIEIGNHVHIGPYCQLAGNGGPIKLHDFCGLSTRSILLTATDDYVYGYLTGPTIPNKYKFITTGSICLHKHVIIGAGSIIMPGITLQEGVAVGAMSFVNRSFEEYSVILGQPAKCIKKRDKDKLKQLEQEFNECNKI